MDDKKSKKRELIKYNKFFLGIGTLLIFALFLLLSISMISIFNNILTEQNRSEFILEKQTSIDGAAFSIQETLSFIADDLLMLSEYVLSDAISEPSDDIWDEAGQMFIKVADITQKYDQIRFIDTLGKEKVRVNYNYGSPEAVLQKELQNKSDRYYFKDSIGLEKGQIYVSVLDLNMEHGQVEIPNKPMIRLSTPVIDEAGNLHGVIVLNYLAKHVLDIFRQMFPESTIPDSSVMMLNSDGYYLVNGANPELEFGFMFPDKQGTSINSTGNAIWPQIANMESGNFTYNDNLYVFAHIHPLENNWTSSKETSQTESHPISADNYYWIILSKKPNSYFAQSVIPLTSLGIIVVILSLFILLIISYLLSSFRETRRVDLHNTRVFARYDSMTKLDKREYGMKKLESLCTLKKEEKGKFAVLYLDLDKFKPLNDTYGHKAGDFCLFTIGKRISANIRNKDFAIRLGGDEFLIVFEEANDTTKLIEIAKRIKNEIIKPISFDEISFTVGVSIGIACYPTNGKSVDVLMTVADDAMYKAKHSESGIIASWTE